MSPDEDEATGLQHANNTIGREAEFQLLAIDNNLYKVYVLTEAVADLNYWLESMQDTQCTELVESTKMHRLNYAESTRTLFCSTDGNPPVTTQQSIFEEGRGRKAAKESIF